MNGLVYVLQEREMFCLGRMLRLRFRQIVIGFRLNSLVYVLQDREMFCLGRMLRLRFRLFRLDALR